MPRPGQEGKPNVGCASGAELADEPARMTNGGCMSRFQVARADPAAARSARARQLRAELRRIARDQMAELALLMRAAEVMADDVVQGGEAFPHGTRDLCRRLAQDLHDQRHTLEIVAGRA
jgi:hypothetical protein